MHGLNCYQLIWYWYLPQFQCVFTQIPLTLKHLLHVLVLLIFSVLMSNLDVLNKRIKNIKKFKNKHFQWIVCRTRMESQTFHFLSSQLVESCAYRISMKCKVFSNCISIRIAFVFATRCRCVSLSFWIDSNTFFLYTLSLALKYHMCFALSMWHVRHSNNRCIDFWENQSGTYQWRKYFIAIEFSRNKYGSAKKGQRKTKRLLMMWVEI